MSSINTNAAAMTALKTLQMTNNSLATTQNRISTGFRVAEASDNAAYWSIATTMRSDVKSMTTVQDALGLGAAKVDTAYTGMNAAMDLVDEIKSKLVLAREGGVDRAKVQDEISALQKQLEGIGKTGFSGENWLTIDSTDGEAVTKSIVSAFNRASDGSVSVATIDITLFDGTTNDVALFDENTTAANKVGLLDTQFTIANGAATSVDVEYTISTLNISGTDITDAVLDDMISKTDAALKSMTTAASQLGSAKKRIDIQSTFVSNLMNAIDRGVGQLVDADMNKESTRLQALQVQQQLGIQALSIANGSAQSILSLFR